MKFFSKIKFKKIKWRNKKYLFNYITRVNEKKRDFFFRNKTHYLFFKFVKAIVKKGLTKKITLVLLNIFNIFFKFIKSYDIFDTDLDDLEMFANSLLKSIEMLRRDYSDVIKEKIKNGSLL